MENLDHYVNMLNEAYKIGTNNHPEHNPNPKYWDLLLGNIKSNPEKWNGKKALDFGCGKGRNITNMLSLSNWERVDGIDVSISNIDFCKGEYTNQNSIFYKNNGADLADLNSNEYDFVMSTIVLQHICVHELRYKLKKEIYRVLKTGGEFSFQMGFGPIEWEGHTKQRSYFENGYNAENSNGSNDVRVSNPQDLIDDLSEIGFKNIEYSVEESWADGGHPNWIYVRCYK
jgi:SAM-dependent methyltransferase